MHTFIDAAGRTWTITINVAAIKRVRGMVGVDLYTLIDDGLQPLGALVADPVRLADVLYCLCKDEAEARQVSDEDFGRSLYGDVIATAAEAFVEELVDFFPDPRVRASLRRVVQASRKVKDRLLEHAETALERLDPDAEARRLSVSHMNSRGSSGSTPAPSPSPS